MNELDYVSGFIDALERVAQFENLSKEQILAYCNAKASELTLEHFGNE